MKNLLLAIILICFSCAMFAQQQVKTLTPNPNSPTAMRGCGADLEAIQASGLNQEYIFDGTEVLSDMQYCVDGNELVAKTKYNVPAGTKGHIDATGTKVVVDACLNKATCVNCKHPAPPASTPPLAEKPAPIVPHITEVPPPSNPYRPLEWEVTDTKPVFHNPRPCDTDHGWSAQGLLDPFCSASIITYAGIGYGVGHLPFPHLHHPPLKTSEPTGCVDPAKPCPLVAKGLLALQ